MSKEKFLNKLEELGAKEKYLAYVDKPDVVFDDDFQTILGASFIWSDTTEGFDYWDEIYEQLGDKEGPKGFDLVGSIKLLLKEVKSIRAELRELKAQK